MASIQTYEVIVIPSALLKAVHNTCVVYKQDTDNMEDSGFQSLALFCSTEIIWSHFETDIIEIKALSNQYCIAAWSIEEAIPGIKGASTFYLLTIRFLSPSQQL